MCKYLPHILSIIGLAFTSFLPVQRAQAGIYSFASGYDHLLVPGLITISSGAAVCLIGCVGGSRAICSPASCETAITLCGIVTGLGIATLASGAVVLDEAPTDFQFAHLDESEAVRLNFLKTQVESFNENLPYINAVLQRIEKIALALNMDEGIKIWKEFKEEFSQISPEAIEVTEILSNDLLYCTAKKKEF
jgi:hypothetical protein